MKKLLTALLLMNALSVVAYADGNTLGKCSLKGAKQAPGWVFLPWMKDKETFENITFEQCLDNARGLKKKIEDATYDDCDMNGPCHNQGVTVKIKRVDYNFTSADETISGSLRNP